MKPSFFSALISIILLLACESDKPFEARLDPLNFSEVTISNNTDGDCPPFEADDNPGYSILVDINDDSLVYRLEAGENIKVKLPKGKYVFRRRCDDGAEIDTLHRAVPMQSPLEFKGECQYCIPKPDGLMIDDFDHEDFKNLLGFRDGYFDTPVGTVDTSRAKEPENVLRGKGRSLQIDFYLNDDASFGGWVTTLNNGEDSSRGTSFNLKNLGLNTLAFWVKGASPKTYFEVALKDNTLNCKDDKGMIDKCQTNPKKIYLAPTYWRKIKIPVDSLLTTAQTGVKVDLTRLREVSLGFAKRAFLLQDSQAELNGTIYIDEIAFER